MAAPRPWFIAALAVALATGCSSMQDTYPSVPPSNATVTRVLMQAPSVAPLPTPATPPGATATLPSATTTVAATPVADVMDEDVPHVLPDDRAESAARILAEYNLLAVPVLDESRRLIGVVTVDDALAELLPEIWQRRRAFA